MPQNKTIITILLFGLISSVAVPIDPPRSIGFSNPGKNCDWTYARAVGNIGKVFSNERNERAGDSYEAQGLDRLEKTGKKIDSRPIKKVSVKKTPPGRLNPVLLIPDWITDSVGMYDPDDGTFLGNLLYVPLLYGTISSPKNAILGPDRNIYVSDQVQDAVFVFDTTGAFLYVYADSSDGLNNIRGIAFRGDHMFVTSATAPPRVFEFSGPHTFVRNFIQDGSDPFDIFFLADGRALLSDIYGTTDNIRLYDSSGTFLNQLFTGNFPQQIQFDPVLPGAFLNAMWGADQIIEFELDGTITKTLPLNDVRGTYRLGNGNLLATNNTGVYELDSLNGAVIQQENTGSAQYIELCSASVPGIIIETVKSDIFKLTIAPNPAINVTAVRYSLSMAGPVSFKLYNVTGSLVKSFTKTNPTKGGVFFIDAKTLSSGVYILRFNAGDIRVTRKMVLEK